MEAQVLERELGTSASCILPLDGTALIRDDPRPSLVDREISLSLIRTAPAGTSKRVDSIPRAIEDTLELTGAPIQGRLCPERRPMYPIS